MDSQTHFTELTNRFAEFRKSNFLYDTVLYVGDKEFRVHGLILASASKFFESLLQAYDKPEMRCIKLPLLDPEVMAVVLDYIYTGKVYLPLNEDTQEFSMPPNLVETFTELGINLVGTDGHILAYKREEDYSLPVANVKQESKMYGNPEQVNISLQRNQCLSKISEHSVDAPQHYYNIEPTPEPLPNVKTVFCGDCGLSFRGLAEKEEHVKFTHATKAYLCGDCGDQFNTEGELVRHVRDVHPDKNYFTPESFSHSSNFNEYPSSLKYHEQTEKEFGCDFCGKTFRYRSQLKSHINTHNGERPFECEICHKKFSAILNLTQHMRTHTGEKPFPCPTCDKVFTQRSHLMTHSRTHTGEKPFQCKLCPKAYKNRLDLRIHCQKTHDIDIRLREANHPNSLKRD